MPLLVNTIGHASGALVFALSLYFLLAASSRGRRPASLLSLAAASLAFLWNFASLAVLACREFSWPGAELSIAISTSALSLLPAVLLHLALGPRHMWIVRMGYSLGAIAVLMHGLENLGLGFSHQSALIYTTIGFGALTIVGAIAMRGKTSRLIGAMAMFLFAVSLAHAGAEEHTGGALEILAHHGGIGLALIVLLQDYRFILLDSFIRVLANLALGGGFIVLALPLASAATPFRRGMAFVALLLLLWFYSEMRVRLQVVLTRLVFGRHERELLTADADNEGAYLESASRELASFLRAELRPADPALTEGLALPGPVAVGELAPARRDRLEAAGVEAIVPVRLPAGETHCLLLGYRAGGRRYLSEDLRAAERLAAQIAERVETFRSAELRRLVTQAELRALESQIQPHFLFNVLNTLYGLIPRQAQAARATVLNLSDLLRYHLKQDRTFIALEEELRTVEAYLEIEKLRLGARLRVRLEIDPDVRAVPIPVLSLEPLVENAVKHAVAARPEGGEITVRVTRRPDGGLTVRVEDTGPGFATEPDGNGVGLANVRRRVALCYGGDLIIESSPSGSSVEFIVPMPKAAAA
jgi:two-component system, LytTR family, sensor kinase